MLPPGVDASIPSCARGSKGDPNHQRRRAKRSWFVSDQNGLARTRTLSESLTFGLALKAPVGVAFRTQNEQTSTKERDLEARKPKGVAYLSGGALPWRAMWFHLPWTRILWTLHRLCNTTPMGCANTKMNRECAHETCYQVEDFVVCGGCGETLGAISRGGGY